MRLTTTVQGEDYQFEFDPCGDETEEEIRNAVEICILFRKKIASEKWQERRERKNPKPKQLELF